MTERTELQAAILNLRKLATGRVEWRVQNPVTKTYCLSLDDSSSLNPKREATEWLEEFARKFPGHDHAKYEVAEVRVFSKLEKAAIAAADLVAGMQLSEAPISRAEWKAQAKAFYLECGDDEATAIECAAYLCNQQDWAGGEVGDPRYEAQEDVHGRGGPSHGAAGLTPEPEKFYSLDRDSSGIRALTADAITGALALGAQGTNPPPAGHWLTPFWDMARAMKIAAKHNQNGGAA